jgi:hypothetical protein
MSEWLKRIYQVEEHLQQQPWRTRCVKAIRRSAQARRASGKTDGVYDKLLVLADVIERGDRP